jgi:hypothetical protein
MHRPAKSSTFGSSGVVWEPIPVRPSCWYVQRRERVRPTRLADTGSIWPLSKPATSLEVAKREFEKKFYDKTSNRWRESLSGGFIKCGGKMFPLDMEYEDDSANQSSGVDVPSTLEPQLQQLIKLIFDTNTMQQALEAMKVYTTRTR